MNAPARPASPVRAALVKERRKAPKWRRLLHPHARPVDLAVAGLLSLLGFALVLQVRSTQSDGLLVSARQEDLVQILDDLTGRRPRCGREVATLTATQGAHHRWSGASTAALAEARRRAAVLGVLAGTLPATGPGVQVRILDPDLKVSASLLLDALEELRNAGAEAVQIEGTGPAGAIVVVRVVASTAFVDDAQGVTVDGAPLVAPYRFTVLGDSSALAGAMAIPGGVEDAVRQAGGTPSSPGVRAFGWAPCGRSPRLVTLGPSDTER